MINYEDCEFLYVMKESFLFPVKCTKNLKCIRWWWYSEKCFSWEKKFFLIYFHPRKFGAQSLSGIFSALNFIYAMRAVSEFTDRSENSLRNLYTRAKILYPSERTKGNYKNFESFKTRADEFSCSGEKKLFFLSILILFPPFLLQLSVQFADVMQTRSF